MILAAVAAVVLLASTIQTLAGFGFALVGVPLLMRVIGVREAVILVSLLSLVNTLLVARAAGHAVPWPRVRGMLIGSLLGIPLGLAALLWASESSLRLGVGLATAAMALGLALGSRRLTASTTRDLSVGVVSGVLSTSTGMNGPPIVLYLQGLGTGPLEFRATLAVFFSISGALSLAAFGVAQLISARALQLALLSLPCGLIGNWIGMQLFRRISPAPFRRLVLALLIASGLAAAIGAGLELLRLRRPRRATLRN